jgi:hypothetical protein
MKRAGFLAILLLTLPVLAEQPAPALRPDQAPVIDVRSAEEYREAMSGMRFTFLTSKLPTGLRRPFPIVIPVSSCIAVAAVVPRLPKKPCVGWVIATLRTKVVWKTCAARAM